MKQLLALRLVPADTTEMGGARTVSFELPDSSKSTHPDSSDVPVGDDNALSQVVPKKKKKGKRSSRGRARNHRKPVDPDTEKEGEGGQEGVDGEEAEEAEETELSGREDGPALLIPRSNPMRAWSKPDKPGEKVPRSAFHLAQVDALVKEIHKAHLEDASSRPSSRNQNEIVAMLPVTLFETPEPDPPKPLTESPSQLVVPTSEGTNLTANLPAEAPVEGAHVEDECVQPVDQPAPAVVFVEGEIQDREPTPELASSQVSISDPEISTRPTHALAMEPTALAFEPCQLFSESFQDSLSQETDPKDEGGNKAQPAMAVLDDEPRVHELESRPGTISTSERPPGSHQPPRTMPTTRKPRPLGRPRIPTPAPTSMTAMLLPQVSIPTTVCGTTRPSWLSRPKGGAHLRPVATNESPLAKPKPRPKLFGISAPSPAPLLVPPHVLSPASAPQIDSRLERRHPASPSLSPEKTTVRHLWTSEPGEDLLAMQDSLLLPGDSWRTGFPPPLSSPATCSSPSGCDSNLVSNIHATRLEKTPTPLPQTPPQDHTLASPHALVGQPSPNDHQEHFVVIENVPSPTARFQVYPHHAISLPKSWVETGDFNFESLGGSTESLSMPAAAWTTTIQSPLIGADSPNPFCRPAIPFRMPHGPFPVGGTRPKGFLNRRRPQAQVPDDRPDIDIHDIIEIIPDITLKEKHPSPTKYERAGMLSWNRRLR